MGNAVAGLEPEDERVQAFTDNIRRRPSTTVFSQNVNVNSPRDVGSRDREVHPPPPQNLGFRNMSAPYASPVKKNSLVHTEIAPIGVSNRKKRESAHRVVSRRGGDDYLMKRYSFMRQRRTSVAESEGNALGRNSKAVVLDANEISAIADCSDFELSQHGYNLQQWEQIYKQLSRMYDKVHRGRLHVLDTETINSDEVSMPSSGKTLGSQEIKVPKWTLERALDKVSRCIEGCEEYRMKQNNKWTIWEEKNELKNKIALRQMQAFVPVDIKSISVKDIVQKHGRSWPLAKRLVEKKIFHMLYMTPEEILRVHNSDFAVKGRFDYTGLDLVELRAVYYSTKDLPNAESLKWRIRMREFLYEYTVKDEAGTLSKFTKRHHAYSYKPTNKGKVVDVEFDTEEKERLTTAIRAKTKCLLGEIEHKSLSKKKEVLTRVERFTGSSDNKYTRMVRRQLSIAASNTNSSAENDHEEEEEEEDLAASFDLFYTTGSFSGKNVKKLKDDDSDIDEMESIEQLVRELSARVSSPEELERLLATVFE